MALILTEEQVMLRDAVDGFLADNAPIKHLRALRDSRDPDGLSRQLWQSFGEMGFAGVVIDEEHGGSGLGAVEAGVIAQSLGRTLTPSPFLSSAILAATVLKMAGSEDQRFWLSKIAAGDAIIALAVDEGAKHAPHRINTTATHSGNGFKLSGSKSMVLDGHMADALIVVAQCDDAIGLFLVDPNTPGVSIERTVMVDAHNAARITFNDVELTADAQIGTPEQAQAALSAALTLGTACTAATLNGAGQQTFDDTMDYLKTRQQFGKLIGEFQALQHRAAHLYTELELTHAATLGALQAIDAHKDNAALAASIAKAKAGRVAELAVQEGVQMHGGVGMTDEFDIGLFMKRVRVLNETMGDTHYHAAKLADARGY